MVSSRFKLIGEKKSRQLLHWKRIAFSHDAGDNPVRSRHRQQTSQTDIADTHFAAAADIADTHFAAADL
jgi:hypothetical protein